jgi:hypothetical protein
MSHTWRLQYLIKDRPPDPPPMRRTARKGQEMMQPRPLPTSIPGPGVCLNGKRFVAAIPDESLSIAWFIFCALNLADFVTTLVGLNLGADELNPLARWLISCSFGAYISIKVFAVPALVAVLDVRRYRVIVWGLVALYCFAVASNLKELIYVGR